MRTVLHQVWATLYVEFVVKNPLAPVEHGGGDGKSGVGNELFEGGLETFMVSRFPSPFLSFLRFCFSPFPLALSLRVFCLLLFDRRERMDLLLTDSLSVVNVVF
jgi:hypothetical protein